MSAQYAIEPDVRPVDPALPRVVDRRERSPRQPFPDLPARDERKRKPVEPTEKPDDTSDGERHIDIRV